MYVQYIEDAYDKYYHIVGVTEKISKITIP